jgi:opacity protein-like surface antigen
MRKNLIVGIALAILFLGSSIANAQVFASFVDESDSSWTGAYGGIHLGHGWGDMDDSLDCNALEDDTGISGTVGSISFNSFAGGTQEAYCDDLDFPNIFPGPNAISALGQGDYWENLTDQDNLNGWLGGVQLGFLYQISKFVVGMEVSSSVTNMSDTRVSIIAIDPNGLDLPGTFEFKSDVNFLMTSVVRAGFSILPDLVLSVKGGLAFAQIDFESSAEWKDSNTVEGWTVGLQGDLRLTKNTSAFISFDHMSFEDVKFRGQSTFLVLHFTNYHEYDFDINAFKLGLNYHF